MTSFTKFSLRFAIYLTVLAYLAADLFLFNGPLNQRLNTFRTSYNPTKDTVARVFGHEISRSQLDRAILEKLYLTGKTADDFSKLPPEQQKIITYAALGDLIDHELLRTKVSVNSHKLTVSDQEIKDRLELFTKAFPSAAELTSAMQSQGIPDETALRNRIAARIQQEKYVAMRVDPLVTVTEEEISSFYEKNQDSLTTPERIRARHIFIATLNTPSETAKQTLQTVLNSLKSDTTNFTTLAKKISTDPATANSGGDIGWMSRARLPQDFASATFALPLNQPTLIQTKLGWHIVEVTDRKPAQLPPLESLRQEIHTAISNAKRHQAVNDFRTELRRFEKEKIHIYHDHISPDHTIP